jgi:hypothetical protein
MRRRAARARAARRCDFRMPGPPCARGPHTRGSSCFSSSRLTTGAASASMAAERAAHGQGGEGRAPRSERAASGPCRAMHHATAACGWRLAPCSWPHATAAAWEVCAATQRLWGARAAGGSCCVASQPKDPRPRTQRSAVPTKYDDDGLDAAAHGAVLRRKKLPGSCGGSGGSGGGGEAMRPRASESRALAAADPGSGVAASRYAIKTSKLKAWQAARGHFTSSHLAPRPLPTCKSPDYRPPSRPRP